MWLYRAYSGNLYHGGEVAADLPGFTQVPRVAYWALYRFQKTRFSEVDDSWAQLAIFKARLEPSRAQLLISFMANLLKNICKLLFHLRFHQGPIFTGEKPIP